MKKCIHPDSVNRVEVKLIPILTIFIMDQDKYSEDADTINTVLED
jgi:hypothetical protein